ncbi:RHS repeat-associated core domain-containing protein [Microbacterium insulae]|uniref:RHS repeat-associated core domain-containing protein n=1 Tax=Microbacterium insulae TaxID=483014 RepID=A0ABW3AK75_9MICO
MATKILYPSGSGVKTLAIGTDDQGRRTDVWLDTNATNSAWKGHTHQDYDASGRVSRSIAETVDTGGNPVTVIDVSYCYNTTGTPPTCGTGAATDRAKLQWERNNLTGQVTVYGYDTAGHLTSAAQTGGTSPTAWTYTYDARGNRLTATATGGVSSSQTLTFNAGNQVTTAGYSFDGAGNMTADPAGTYTYNGAQQMTGVSNGSGSFAYKYAGSSQVEVVQQQTSTTTYKLVYGRLNQVGMPVIEQAKIGSVTAYVENDPVTGQPLMLRTSTGAVSLYVYDGTGNPTAILRDVTGTGYVYTYDPYGLATLSYTSGGSGTGQNPFLFKGGIQDRATGWVHYGNRWYNPTTGRWTQQDTLDAPLDPNNANRYAYAGCDPINNLDPTGQLTLACTSALLRLSGNILGQLVRVAGFTGLIFGASVIPPAAILTAGALLAAGSAIGAFTTAISINDVARQC